MNVTERAKSPAEILRNTERYANCSEYEKAKGQMQMEVD